MLCARQGRSRSVAAALALFLTCSLVAVAKAQDFWDPDETERQFEPPLGLSENLSGIVRPRSNDRLHRIDTLRDIFRAIGACWDWQGDTGFTQQELTLRLAFRRNGEFLGKPRVTYYRPGPDHRADRREAFSRSVEDAFARCLPLPFTEKLAAAVAGRVFIFRFSDTPPM